MERINISKKKIIIGIFAFLILTVFGYLFLPYFYFENAIVLGETSLSKKEILELSKIDKDNNIYKISLKAAEGNIKSNPYIKDIKIKRKFPKTLVFSIKQRFESAIIPVTKDYAIIDEEGVVLKIQTDVAAMQKPIISGIKPVKVQLGKKIPIENEEQFTAILSMISVSQNARLLESISDINLKNLENIYMTTSNGITVLLGDGSGLNDKMLRLNKILVDLHTKGIHYGVIDMRYNSNPVYREG